MFLVIRLVLGIGQNVVNKHDDELIKVRLANAVHQVHEHRRYVSETKRHDQELKMAITSAKSSLLDVGFLDTQLVITGPHINLRIVAGALELVKEIINASKRITILDGHFVQLTIVNTHAKTSVLLLHKQNRSSPRGRTRSDETLFQEFLQLAGQLLHLGRYKTIRSSGNRSCAWSEINTKLNLTMGWKTR